ncbi:uncharacterized protein LOC110029160 isoform X2 [Phalaenopsis equestris]|uniref:uncharacterized protein LOC110029160 isoform X2 n=1 Tax=Phalaenopsis equestris TaxID=78828 RepID=UPI0009E5DE54|nr:uncharacterized protein LOC110029160 isoform X2 [Phalaenopsis equestris]
MSIAAAPPPDLLRLSACRKSNRQHFPGKFTSANVGTWSLIRASNDWKEECSVDGNDLSMEWGSLGISRGPSDLRFDRLQPSEEEISCKHRRVFGRYIAREAVLDEEYWTAAWLRAESHWEDQPGDRHLQFNKRKFADQEFHAIKRRCTGKYADDCACIITVKKEDICVKRTVLSSIVGTLDFSLRQLFSGQTFPCERSKAPISCGIYRSDLPRYGYIANLCVAKYARRQGIASNMLHLAMDAAKSSGVGQVFVNVHKDNITAQKLYERVGFQIFEKAIPQPDEENLYLLCYNL